MSMTAKELKLDYFQIYDVENRDATGDVVLKGQFDKERLKMQIRLLDYFANPVMKNGEPYYDKTAHLAWYRGIQPAEPMRVVSLENQFGKFKIRTGTGYGLLVPTHKVEPGSAAPKTLSHFKVYRLAEVIAVPKASLKLSDQFGASEAKLMVPLYFAVPVLKNHAGKDYPIENERAHLLILSISPQDIQKEVRLRNQFTPNDAMVNVVRRIMLAVPSIKHEWKPV